MKDILKLGFALMVYCIIAGLALGIINSKTAPVIAEQERMIKQKAIEEVLPTNDNMDTKAIELPDGTELEYTVGSQGGQPTGYAVTALASGFSSVIRTIVGINPDFTVNKIAVVYQNETPGLGTKCEDADFKGQFAGLSLENIAVKQDGGKIEAITGATITSRALANSVKETAELLKTKLPKDAPEAPIDSLATEGDSPMAQTQEGGE